MFYEQHVIPNIVHCVMISVCHPIMLIHICNKSENKPLFSCPVFISAFHCFLIKYFFKTF